MKDLTKAMKEMRSQRKEVEVIINPDSVQIMAYANRSNHPVYPLKHGRGLTYIVRNHHEQLTRDDPHPCEWDAREAAQNILHKE